MPEPIRVALVEDQREIREGLRYLIAGTDGFHCTGSFGSIEEALPPLTAGTADVALVDIGPPGLSGIEGIRLLKERRPELRTMALTIYQDDDRIFEALCAGASGYLLKKTPPARLLECLREVMAGNTGTSSQPHLHWDETIGLKFDDEGNLIGTGTNPSRYEAHVDDDGGFPPDFTLRTCYLPRTGHKVVSTQ